MGRPAGRNSAVNTYALRERTALRGDAKGTGFVVAFGFDGIYTSLHTSPDGVKIGRWMEYDPDKPYKKQHLFYSRDAMGGPERFYLGTLYVQIR